MTCVLYKPFAFFFLLSCVKDGVSTQKPHQLLDTIRDCDIPSDKISPDGIWPHFIQVIQVKPYEKIIRGNVTVPQKTLPIIFNVRTYKLQNSTKVLLYNIAGLTCKNPLIVLAMRQIKFKHSNDCSALSGNYIFNDVSENQFRKSEFIVLTPGQYIHEFELTTKKGVLLCFQSKINVEK